MFTMAVFKMMAFHVVRLTGDKRDPVADVNVGVVGVLRVIVTSEADSPVANGELDGNGGHGRRSVVRVTGVHQEFAGVVAGQEEAVVASFRGVKPSLVPAAESSSFEVSVVFKGGEKSGILDGVGTIDEVGPRGVHSIVSGVNQVFGNALDTGLVNSCNGVGGSNTSLADNGVNGRGLHSAVDTIDFDGDIVEVSSLETISVDSDLLATGLVTSRGTHGVHLGVNLDSPAVVTGKVAMGGSLRVDLGTHAVEELGLDIAGEVVSDVAFDLVHRPEDKVATIVGDSVLVVHGRLSESDFSEDVLSGESLFLSVSGDQMELNLLVHSDLGRSNIDQNRSQVLLVAELAGAKVVVLASNDVAILLVEERDLPVHDWCESVDGVSAAREVIVGLVEQLHNGGDSVSKSASTTG